MDFVNWKAGFDDRLHGWNENTTANERRKSNRTRLLVTRVSLPAKVRASVATRKMRRGPGALGTRVGSIHAGGAQGDRWQPTESRTTVPTVASYALANRHPRSSWCFRRLSSATRGQTISTPSPLCVEAHENRPTCHPTDHPTRMLRTTRSDDALPCSSPFLSRFLPSFHSSSFFSSPFSTLVSLFLLLF